jgi:hypothetical protein
MRLGLSLQRGGAQMRHFMTANFLERPKLYSWDLLKPKAEQNYLQWTRRTQALSYNLREDCAGMLRWLEENRLTLHDLFRPARPQENRPIIVRMERDGLIELETVVLLDNMLRFMQRLRDEDGDETWTAYRMLVSKYSYLLECDLESLTLCDCTRTNRASWSRRCGGSDVLW